MCAFAKAIGFGSMFFGMFVVIHIIAIIMWEAGKAIVRHFRNGDEGGALVPA